MRRHRSAIAVEARAGALAIENICAGSTAVDWTTTVDAPAVVAGVGGGERDVADLTLSPIVTVPVGPVTILGEIRHW